MHACLLDFLTSLITQRLLDLLWYATDAFTQIAAAMSQIRGKANLSGSSP
jgi:hypothetical protein